MPRSRSRGGTRTPRAGDETRRPAMLISPSIAGRPTENCLRRPLTSSVAVMTSFPLRRSLPVAVDLVPICDPFGVQLHVIVELGIPDLDYLRIETFGIDRRHL